MPLKIHFKSGQLKGHTLDFDDELDYIQFGRDRDRCDVVLPMSAVMVAREHFGLKRVLGRYRLVTNGINPVYVDGRPGQEDEILEPLAEVRVGEDGPVLLVETVLDPRLQKALAGTPRPESPQTVRRRLKRKVVTNRVVLVATLLLVIGAIVAIFFVGTHSRRDRTRISDVERRLESTRLEVTTLSKQERERIAEVLKQLRDEDPIRRFRSLIARVEPSIYLVMVEVKKGTHAAVGTAWVVGKGLLATNAHVAEVFEKLKPGQKYVVRSSSAVPRDFEVKSVVIHPGFHRFEQAVADHHPLDPTSGDQASFIPACDVGLLRVAEDADLGSPLEIATPAELHGLEAGEGVAFVGYPLEGVTLRDVTRPQPTSQIGHITSLTDVFNGKTIPALRLLVRHNLPLTGGVSGSPLFNRSGKVVAVISAGSFHVISDPLTGLPRRVPTFVGINFAQRADLLDELLHGRAAAAQAARDKEWRTELTRFKSGRKTRAEIVDALKRYFETHVRSRGGRIKSVEEVLERRGHIKKPDLKNGVAFQVDVAATGYYLITAIADQVKDIDMAVFRGTRVIAKDEMRDHFPSVISRLDAGVGVKILVHLKPGNKLPDAPFTLMIFRAVE